MARVRVEERLAQAVREYETIDSLVGAYVDQIFNLERTLDDPDYLAAKQHRLEARTRMIHLQDVVSDMAKRRMS